MGLDFLVPIFGILIVLVPVTGITAILTLRLGGKPFIETLAREFKGLGNEQGTDLHLSVVELAEQVESLKDEIRELRAAQAFDRRLLEAGREPSRMSPRDDRAAAEAEG
jgi:hypothetical protein